MLRKTFKTLSHYILTASVVFCITRTTTPAVSAEKLKVASAEVLTGLVTNEGEKRGRHMHMQ
jgi:hypothetical protein